MLQQLAHRDGPAGAGSLLPLALGGAGKRLRRFRQDMAGSCRPRAACTLQGGYCLLLVQRGGAAGTAARWLGAPRSPHPRRPRASQLRLRLRPGPTAARCRPAPPAAPPPCCPPLHWPSKKYDTAGVRTRAGCLEGSSANHYTTVPVEGEQNSSPRGINCALQGQSVYSSPIPKFLPPNSRIVSALQPQDHQGGVRGLRQKFLESIGSNRGFGVRGAAWPGLAVGATEHSSWIASRTRRSHAL